MGEQNPFHIAGGNPDPQTLGVPVDDADQTLPIFDRVEKLIFSSDVFLFMKGVPQQPMCGFSANTVAILESLGVPYSTFDVLSDDEIREAVKEYASWPTFPQLWVRGELIGGNDIMVEMTATGELEALLRAGSS
jgi:monothiol glutaredoxin